MKLIDILVEELPKRGGWPEGVREISTHASGRVFFDGRFAPQGFILPRASDAWNKHEHPYSYTNVVTRDQYEAALAAKNEGWIEWSGGNCPVEKGTLIDVKHRDGEIYQNKPAMGDNNTRWSHTGSRGDIIAYRLHKPQEAEQVKADDEADLNECIGQDAAPVWSGEGLPPVGCECEIQFLKDTPPAEWFSFKLIGVHEEIVIVTLDGENTWRHISKFSPDKVAFRPIRTEAERKRDEAIEEMIKIATMYTTKSLGLDLAFNSIYNSIAAGEIPGVKLED
ncbi:hypothetical protein ACR91X_24785 [Klebsiella pneumoniae]